MNEHANLSADLIAPLLSWFRSVRRPLPWRETKDPYRVWLSEIMLQQTRIEAVIPYYHRFLSEAPTVKDLAELPDEMLMKLWEGLGYYSRARNLKKAALTVMEQHGGALPRNFSALRALPGIGDYTAGAIASIAFGLPEPAVDGNVLRVIMRLTGREDDIALDATKKAVTAWLREIYPDGEDAGDLTEGLMELGEKLCLPAGAPKCSECPLASQCVARRGDLWRQLPKKSPKKERRIEEYTLLLLCSEDGVALRKRPSKGLLAGLWEFPMLAGTFSEEELTKRLSSLGIKIHSLTPCGTSSHIFTHITWNMHGMRVLIDPETLPEEFGAFFHPARLRDEIAVPTAYRYFVEQILKEDF
ncbi:MAG: A/G-specific adenine glycosylase [Clostridia bacterium]|nr:A/G-specific adenine glycosylase [Clostridia bacterium]